MANLANSTTHRRTLFQLRAKLTWRLFAREKGRIFFALIGILTFGSMAVGAAIGAYFACTALPQPWDGVLLAFFLIILWLIWAIAPIIFSQINEGADISRLLIYPIRQRDLIYSIFTGTLFDYPTYFAAPLLIAMFAAWGLNATFPIVLLALLIAYLHMVIITQFVMMLLGGLFNSRRFRDVLVVIMSMFGLLGFICGQSSEFIGRFFANTENLNIETWQPLLILRWFPTGALGQSIIAAQTGAWGYTLLWMGYSLLWLAGLTAVWWQLLNRLTTGQGFLITLGSSAPKEERPAEIKPIATLPFLPDQTTALLQQELRQTWRNPTRRLGFIQSFFFPFVVGFITLINNSGEAGEPMPNSFGYFIIAYALFSYWSMGSNMLAWEGHGLANLLLSPISRHRYLISKTISLHLLTSIPFLMITVALYFLALPSHTTLLGITTGLMGGFVSLAVSAVSAVLFPIRVPVDTKNMQGNKAGGGCIASLGITLLTPAVISLASTPLVLVLWLDYWLATGWITAVALLATLFYTAIFYWFVTKGAAQLMLDREPELYEALKQPEVAE